ncbi:hypothetical protein DRJ48_01605 [Candidatus Woesearchaeota archaeon]|nr:hypothetical protein [Candidatus Woesearchaeota archaeon]RLE43183.1 MAG: hypothetical protein DRJ48_01605 [Candidatus Woesearchaeota archaeon]
MTELVATLGTGKGSWNYLRQLITKHDWDSIKLVTNSFGAERFSIEGKEISFVVIDDRKSLPLLIEDIYSQLNGKIEGTEVALNLISGTGKEHMALLSALLKLGLGIRLVGLKGDEVAEI